MKCLYPLPNVATERRNGDTSETCRIKLQSTQGSVQQPTGSYGIVSSEVMKCSCYPRLRGTSSQSSMRLQTADLCASCRSTILRGVESPISISVEQNFANTSM